VSDNPLSDLGPSPRGFREAFGVGASDEVIHPVDAVGAALASIQGTHELLRCQAAKMETLRRRIAEAERDNS